MDKCKHGNVGLCLACNANAMMAATAPKGHTPGCMSLTDAIITLRETEAYLEAGAGKPRSITAFTVRQDKGIALIELREQLEANRELFDAAPDLLVKVRQLATLLRLIRNGETGQGMDLARMEDDTLALIAKAEGK